MEYEISDLILSHVFQEDTGDLPDGGLRVCTFVTRHEDGSYFHGYDTGRVFTKANLANQTECEWLLPVRGKLIYAHPDKGVWMDNKGEFYLVNYKDPLSDKNPIHLPVLRTKELKRA